MWRPPACRIKSRAAGNLRGGLGGGPSRPGSGVLPPRLLREVTQPHYNRVFFTGSGSESIDTIIRMVRRYWELEGQPNRQTLISRVNAYHGSTVAGASLGGMKPMHSQAGRPLPDIAHIEAPYWFGSDRTLPPDEFGIRAARALREKIEEIGPEKVAAFVGERAMAWVDDEIREPGRAAPADRRVRPTRAARAAP